MKKIHQTLLVVAICALAALVVQAIVVVNSINEAIPNASYFTAAFDPNAKLIYMGGQNPTTHQPFFSVYDATTFTFKTSLEIPAISGAFVTSAIDTTRGFIYFGVNAGRGQVVKIRLSDQTFVSSVTFQTGGDTAASSVIDIQNNVAYYGGFFDVTKVDLNTMTETSHIDSKIFELSAALLDTTNGFAYFGGVSAGGGLTGAVSKIRLSDFTFVSSITVTGTGQIFSGVIDVPNNSAYFGTGDAPAKIARVNLGNFTNGTVLTLPATQTSLVSAATDGTYGYFGTFSIPGQIVQVQLSGLVETSSTTVSNTFGITSAAVDPANGFGYFGALTSGGSEIVKVDLFAGTLSIQSQPASISVHPGETATFSVVPRGTATGYQWQLNGLAIAGATSSSYTTPPVSLSDNGAQYSCVVTGPNSLQAVSAAATLTVLPSIKVFPNPWRADRHTGGITFEGLPPGSQVKIFTLSGHWVRELTPTNGTVVWDRTNDVGQSVASGYYFWDVKASDDKQSTQGKLAILK